jgi:hypothetical protein
MHAVQFMSTADKSEKSNQTPAKSARQGNLRHPRVSEISLSCTFAGARFYISSDTWNSLIVTSMIYFEADENGNYIWKDCKKKKSHVFGTQISFVTLWEIATKLKQNKESTPLWVNWTYFFFKIWYLFSTCPFRTLLYWHLNTISLPIELYMCCILSWRFEWLFLSRFNIIWSLCLTAHRVVYLTSLIKKQMFGHT